VGLPPGVSALVSGLAAALLCGCPVDVAESAYQQPPAPESRAEPLCVTGFDAGQALTVHLGEAYDLRSDYEYPTDSPSYLLEIGAGSNPSAGCMGRDGLGPGSDVTFYLDQQYSDLTPVGDVCNPLARVDPPSLASQIWPAVQNGVTIALLVGDADAGISIAQLAAPTMDPYGTLTQGAVPPLVVTRTLGLVDATHNASCGDAWVATWGASP
jgi:hypothetical protein